MSGDPTRSDGPGLTFEDLRRLLAELDAKSVIKPENRGVARLTESRYLARGQAFVLQNVIEDPTRPRVRHSVVVHRDDVEMMRVEILKATPPGFQASRAALDQEIADAFYQQAVEDAARRVREVHDRAFLKGLGIAYGGS